MESSRSRIIGRSIKICQINVEGLSSPKSDYLSCLLYEKDIDVLVIQETHTSDIEQLNTRGKISNFTLVSSKNHPKYGIATFVKNDLLPFTSSVNTLTPSLFSTTIKVHDISISNVYKPPSVSWPPGVHPVLPHPAIYIGDFNSHHTQWGYVEADTNGEQLIDWAENNHLQLMHDSKQLGTFHSARWNRDYNPDLCFLSCSSDGRPLPCSREIIPHFPHSQHRPVIIDIGIKVPLVSSIPKPRWNFQKADWDSYSKKLDDTIRFIPPKSSSYKRFTKLIIKVAKYCIPRGFRKEYIPCWNEETSKLYEDFNRTGNPTTADELLTSLDALRTEKWKQTVESMNFTHSSRKAWSVLRKLGGANMPGSKVTPISPDKISQRIVQLSTSDTNKVITRKVKKELKELRHISTLNSTISDPFTEDEVNEALLETKNGKSAGFDEIYPEFLTNCGPHTRKWLSQFYSDILMSNKLPPDFKKTKIIALLKPGKPNDVPESYRPIALLSVSFKVLERLIHNRIGPVIDEIIPPEQAGFRKGRNCTDQVLGLTNFIENGFQKGLKTAAAFVDLTAAYDTVWKKGLLLKFIKIIPNIKIVNLITNMLSDRQFQILLNDTFSKTKKLNNGLPQGSVLSPLLFNLYIHDLPPSESRKFVYADDMTYAVQGKSWLAIETDLETDLEVLFTYLKKWRLQPSPSKTEVCCYHLHNRESERKLDVSVGGHRLNHNFQPKYLGVILDRSLTYKEHLSKVAAKLQTRNNLIQKLANTSWGASASCLRTSALSLVYSTGEYAAPVWLQSHHTHKVDVQLNCAMRLITGTVRSTPIEWLPALSHIAPPVLRRKHHLLKLYDKLLYNPQIPLHNDIPINPYTRLKSRKPPLSLGKQLLEDDFNVDVEWQSQWNQSQRESPIFDFTGSTFKAEEFSLPRKSMCNLNRLRTQHGRCKSCLLKWGLADDEICDCGHPHQTMEHILKDCPNMSFQGSLEDLKTLTRNAKQWLNKLDL